jgi:two-component system, response regulator, stage 0 sporulation protein F
MARAARVLLAEDDYDLRCAIAAGLRAAGHEVIDVGNGDLVKAYFEECLELDLPKPRIHVLVSDIRMPGQTGLNLLEYLRSIGADMPTILVTAFGDPETHELARKLGARAVLNKPFDLEMLEKTLRDVLDEAHA